MRKLDHQATREFLIAEPRTAVLATTNRDGSPHAVPVWFELDGDEVVMILTGGTKKLANLEQDPRAALCIEDEVLVRFQPQHTAAVVEIAA